MGRPARVQSVSSETEFQSRTKNMSDREADDDAAEDLMAMGYIPLNVDEVRRRQKEERKATKQQQRRVPSRQPPASASKRPLPVPAAGLARDPYAGAARLRLRAERRGRREPRADVARLLPAVY